MPAHRVIVYIDGYNLYYGLRSKKWKWAYWLNLQALAENLLKPYQTLLEVKYFTAIVKRPQGRHDRQSVFLEALQTLPKLRIFYGHFLSDMVTCRNCGHIYETHHEKMTDVNIAVEMLSDAFQRRMDTALLISADSDLIGVVEKVRSLFARRVVVIFPPGRHSNALKKACDGDFTIGRNILKKSLFPEEISKPDGYRLRCPSEWH